MKNYVSELLSLLRSPQLNSKEETNAPEVSARLGELALPAFVPVEDFTDTTTGYKFLIGKIFVAHILLLRHDDVQVFMLRLMLHCVKIDVGLGYRPLVQEELLNFEWCLFSTIGTYINKQMP